MTVVAAYAALSVVLTWPLAVNLRADLPGDPMGDTGVYVWNLWVFRHELVNHHHLPFATDHIFAYTGGSDLSLHNYTPLADALGLPLIPWLGVVGAFNVVLMAVLALSGVGVYLLGRQGRLGRPASWAAGALFMAMPLVSARETAHLSLVTNASLPLFLWALTRALDRPSLAGGALVGVVVAAATYSDAYYGIYCVIMGLFVLAWRYVRVDVNRAGIPHGSPVGPVRWLDFTIAALLVVGAGGIAAGIHDVTIGPFQVRGLDRPYSLMLAAVALGCVRVWHRWRPTFRLVAKERRPSRALPMGAAAVTVCLALLLPLLAGIAVRWADGRLPETVTFWRSSPRGVDLLSYVVPNPTHAVLGRWTERWLLPDVQDAFPELVASCSILALLAVVIMSARGRLPRMWQAFTIVFVLLSLGPFVHIGGVNTFVIGPWAMLRYVPVIGMARSPSRFAIVAALGVAMLFGHALDLWLARREVRARAGVYVFLCLLALEVIPGPRPMHSAEVPEVYRLLAAGADERGRLLELPTGIRDGTSSLGDFNAASSFFQTRHQRPLLGGYLSRVSEWRKRQSLHVPMLRALYQLSSTSEPLAPDLEAAARESGQAFLARSCVQYVVVDKKRASPALQAFARDALGLVSIHDDAHYALLTPEHAPPCDGASEHAVPGDGPGVAAVAR